MERTQVASERTLKTSGEVARHLIEACPSLSEFESFMFGSSLVRAGNDFDILVVGPSGELLSRLKNEIGLAGKNLPLDVLYMLPSEADETGFVLNEKCVPLPELARSR